MTRAVRSREVTAAPTPAPPTYTSADWVAVAAGGAVGTGARAVLLWVWPPVAGSLPWATLVVNLGGALALGVLLGAVARGRPPAWWRSPFFGTGVLGSFTTFSALALELTAMATERPGSALAYAGVSLAGGVAMAALGWRIGCGASDRAPT